ncbi:MAG: PKD domain-containing protein, partial [Candidatus Aenigmarchaeota archaeon]|nr:PKD domain-containing protein [Candidatus Aenigmarchaeota archaeon]
PQQISHVYVNPEVSDLRRIAKVRASDERGRIDATPAEVTIVVESDIGNAPTTDLQATPANGPAPLQVTFAARCRDLQRRLVSCVLDFGDGQAQFLPTVESIQTLTHIYQRDGRYIAALNARDAEGLTDLTPSSVTITVGSLDIVDEDGKAPGEKKRLLEFGIDIANFKEEDSFVSAKRLFNGLLFGSNEIRLDVPKSFVKEVVIEVKETNRLGELVVTLDDQELFRGKPEPVPDNAALKTANLAARYEKGKLIIPVNEDNEGLLKIKVTSSGFIFWAPAVYEIKASVIADVEKVTQDRFDFTLDNELQGFKSARITVLPRGAAVILNDNKIIGEAIPKEYFRQLNTIEFSAAPDTTVSGKVGIEIVYEDV